MLSGVAWERWVCILECCGPVMAGLYVWCGLVGLWGKFVGTGGSGGEWCGGWVGVRLVCGVLPLSGRGCLVGVVLIVCDVGEWLWVV